jgi:hypothetical protein
MFRQILVELALFLLPFAVHAVRLMLRGSDPRVGSNWQGAPIAWMVIGGLVLVAIGLAALALLNDGAAKTGRYVPSHVQDGVLVPGRFEP